MYEKIGLNWKIFSSQISGGGTRPAIKSFGILVSGYFSRLTIYVDIIKDYTESSLEDDMQVQITTKV